MRVTKNKKNLREALICGPTGSFKSSVPSSKRVVGFKEAEDYHADWEAGKSLEDPAEDFEDRVHQYSFDYINNSGASESEIEAAVEKALEAIGVEVVGILPGDTSWSREEYF